MKKCKGVLPSDKWLNANGYGGLVRLIHLQPDLVSHIPQERLLRTEDSQVAEAEELARQNKGKLPSPGWLDRNGYHWLSENIRRKPHLFAHIEQDRQRRTDSGQLTDAEALAKQNGGKIPNSAWLNQNGYTWLNYALSAKAYLFANLTQERLRKTASEQIAEAEKLASKNKGMVPGMVWLTRNGHGSLAQMMRVKPHLFTHLKQDYDGHRTDKEKVAAAEKLARKNQGQLPCAAWLHQNGHGWLVSMKRVKPHLFRHLKQENKGGRTDEEKVRLANKLAKTNGGLLPTTVWLTNNGYGWLVSTKYARPDLLVHIPQERLTRTPNEQVAVAERLANENGGKLPTVTWLCDNGYGGLTRFICKEPQLFEHLEQERRDTHGRLIA